MELSAPRQEPRSLYPHRQLRTTLSIRKWSISEKWCVHYLARWRLSVLLATCYSRQSTPGSSMRSRRPERPPETRESRHTRPPLLRLSLSHSDSLSRPVRQTLSGAAHLCRPATPPHKVGAPTRGLKTQTGRTLGHGPLIHGPQGMPVGRSMVATVGGATLRHLPRHQELHLPTLTPKTTGCCEKPRASLEAGAGQRSRKTDTGPTAPMVGLPLPKPRAETPGAPSTRWTGKISTNPRSILVTSRSGFTGLGRSSAFFADTTLYGRRS